MPNPSEGGGATPADLIEAQASEFEATVRQRTGDCLQVEVKLRLVDGRVPVYDLAIDACTPIVKVREVKPNRLPAVCPERHINADGSFCMNRQAAQPVHVTDSAGAQRWWGLLLAFLKLQERVPGLRRWPSHSAWAHGDAAIYQEEAERCAAALGAAFEQALTKRQLSVRRRRRSADRNGHQTAFLRLVSGGRRLYAVWEAERRVAGLRQRCMCGSRLLLCDCGDHARAAADLVFALLAWEDAERRFWAGFKGKQCCGSIPGCALAANGDLQASLADKAAA